MPSAAKTECEQLMNYLLPYLERFLQEAGEFYPIGAIFTSDGEMRSIAGYDAREHPPSEYIISIIRDGFVEYANNGTIKATALAYDVLVTDPDTGRKHDAIAFELDHIERYSVIVYFRYDLDGGTLILSDATAKERTGLIFS